MYLMTSMFSAHFMIFQVIFILMFLLVIGTFVFLGVTVFRRWRKNENSPRLTVPATVLSKRTHYTSGSHSGRMHHSGSTWYYVTFQLESGDRMELQVYGEQFGLLIEGDRGNLTFQGTRYLSFDRI